MATFSSKFNKGRKFNIDTEGFEYKSLVDCYNDFGVDTIYPLQAIYINTKGQFGDAPVFATDSFFVNVPHHMLETAEEILADEEAITAINEQKVGFTIYPYKADKYNRDCFGVKFVDL